MTELRTCRFCGQSNYDYNHPAVRSHWVRYGPRHWAHLQCGVGSLGEAFVRRLPWYKLEKLPVFELADLKMEGLVRSLLDEQRPKDLEQRKTAWRLWTDMRDQKPWAELADMKVGELILKGGDRAWPEVLRRIERLAWRDRAEKVDDALAAENQKRQEPAEKHDPSDLDQLRVAT